MNKEITPEQVKAKEITWEVPHAMYNAITMEFRKFMVKELTANTRKGDREGREDTGGWLGVSDKTWLGELYYHVGKLQHAVMNKDEERIKENTADLANLAMMMFDNHCPLLPIPFDPSKYGLSTPVTDEEAIVSDEEMEKAFGYSNFGSTPKRRVIQEALEKCTQGYHSGHTASAIVEELGLTQTMGKAKVLTEKGLKYLLAAARKHSVTPVLSDADIQKEAKRLSDKLCLKYRLIRIDFRDKTDDFFLDTARELAEKDRRIAELESNQLSEQEIEEEAERRYPVIDSDIHRARRQLFIEGAKWLLAALTAHPKQHTEKDYKALEELIGERKGWYDPSKKAKE